MSMMPTMGSMLMAPPIPSSMPPTRMVASGTGGIGISYRNLQEFPARAVKESPWKCTCGAQQDAADRANGKSPRGRRHHGDQCAKVRWSNYQPGYQGEPSAEMRDPRLSKKRRQGHS